jgi:iron(III) transport system substrate-binding protein
MHHAFAASRRHFVAAVSCSVASVLLASSSSGVLAQTMSADQLATYAGADRMQQIIEGAKKEGTLTLYSSLTTDDMAAITPLFQKKYGIKINFWRGSSQDIRDRAIAEAKNHRYDVDLVETAGPDLVAIDRQKIFRPVTSPVDSQLTPESFFKGQDWVGTRVSLITGAYNTDVIKDPPKSYEDLTKPAYKGNLGIEAGSDWWLMTIADVWGEKKAIDFFKSMVSTNGVSARQGHTLLANLVASGEVPLAITTYSYKVDQLTKQGAPIKRIDWDPVVGLMTGMGVAAKAPHPYAALLFRDFFITEAQGPLAKLDAVPVNKNYISQSADLHVKYVDPVQWLDQDQKWATLYKSLFVTKAH